MSDQLDAPLTITPDADTPTHLIELGAIFHEHTTNLMTILQVINRSIESLGPYPFKDQGEPTPDEVDATLAGPASSLKNSLFSFIESVKGDWEKRGIPEEFWSRVIYLNIQTQDYNFAVNRAMFRPPLLYLIAREVVTLFESIRGAGLPKEKVKGIIREAK